MKRFSLSGIISLILGLVLFAGCGEISLSTTNERLDGTESQESYRTSSISTCDIRSAYENGLLTQTDLAYAMYYASGKVFTCKKSDWASGRTEAIKELDFVPTEECPALSEQVEADIKNYYYQTRIENVTSFEEFVGNVSFRFVGSYHGTFIITAVKSIYWDYPTDVPPPAYIAGFVWNGSYANDLFAFRYE